LFCEDIAAMPLLLTFLGGALKLSFLVELYKFY